ncbi:hypothetical protein PTI98_008719 [Pleurotus ostreatus]|nr:hypothetical protein PTI98_008719 [Pleurotus ostreatus]
MRTMDTSTSINLVRFNQLPQRCMLNEYWISVGVATRRWRHYIFSSHFPSVDHRVLSVGRSIVSFTYTNGAHVTPYQEGNESQVVLLVVEAMANSYDATICSGHTRGS